MLSVRIEKLIELLNLELEHVLKAFILKGYFYRFILIFHYKHYFDHGFNFVL